MWFRSVCLVVCVLCGTAGCSGADGAKEPESPAPSGPPLLPCDVAQVLRDHCASCHGSQLRRSAPISLVTPDIFLANRNGQVVATTVLARIETSDARVMPPPPDAPLDAADTQTLRAWITAGAQPAPRGMGCEVEPGGVPVGGASGGTTAGMSVTAGASGAAGSAGSAGSAGIVASGSGGMGGAGGSGGDAGTVAPTGDGWRVFGHDLDNSRDSSHDGAPTPENVSGLRRLWEFTGPATTSTPAVADGVVYLPGWDAKLYALRLEDKSEVWTATLPALIDSSPALNDTHVFVADDKGSMHAVDRTSGSISWSMRVDPHPETHLWSSPVLVPDENLLILGVASSEEAVNAGSWTFRGSVVGLDATTGAIRFQVYTTPGDAASGAGIGVWATAAVDTTRGLAFIGTGNNYTPPTGPNADAMLAIDYRAGTLEWAHQFTADDVFVVGNPMGPDFDIGSSANLFRAGDKDLLGIGIKSGLYYALDRDTGGEEWMAMVSSGSVLGGVISASAYADGRIFVASNERSMGQTVAVALDAATGIEQWRQVVPTDTYSGVSHANGVVYFGTNGGTLHALDAQNGTPLFTDTLPDSIAGGPVVVDGVLLVPWGYQWTLRGGQPGSGGLIAYGL